MEQPSKEDSKWQNRLQEWCNNEGEQQPTYQVISDRRGGRTAWSSTVTVKQTQYQARYWYDGSNLNNAKEDAAEVALQQMGVVPAPGNNWSGRWGTGVPA